MKKRKVVLPAIGLLLFAGFFYGFNEYTRTKKDLSRVGTELSITASKLVQEFEADETAANKQFLPKEDFVIKVTGKIRDIKKDDHGKYTVVLSGDEENMSSVQCSIDPGHAEEVMSLKKGLIISVKGVVAGFNADELLGSDVFLSRAIVADN